MEITSLQNPHVKYVAKLRASRRQRRRDGMTLVEGWEEIRLAVSAGHQPHTLLAAPALTRRPLEGIEAEKLTVSRAVFQRLSHRENPDGWLAVFAMPRPELEDLRLSNAPLLIVAEALEKPGNLGGILRTADAAGVDAVLVCDPHVDLYGPNVVRASRGAIFTVPTVAVSSEQSIEFLRRRGIRILAATPNASSSYWDQDLRGPLAVAVGTEDQGLTDAWVSQADAKVKIPMMGKVDSLNVSIATAVIIYEALRQRGK
jgi:TrmH family RNA methyltransferase